MAELDSNGAFALTYDECLALQPCQSGLDLVADRLGGKDSWRSEPIDAAAAKAAGVDFKDVLWAAAAKAKTDPDAARRLRLWMADVAVQVLEVFEQADASDAPREAIIAARAFARGAIGADAAATASNAAVALSDFMSGPTDSQARDAAYAAGKAADDSFFAGPTIWVVRYVSLAALHAGYGAAGGDKADRDWQYQRLVEWFAEAEPADLPLPPRLPPVAVEEDEGEGNA